MSNNTIRKQRNQSMEKQGIYTDIKDTLPNRTDINGRQLITLIYSLNKKHTKHIKTYSARAALTEIAETQSDKNRNPFVEETKRFTGTDGTRIEELPKPNSTEYNELLNDLQGRWQIINPDTNPRVRTSTQTSKRQTDYYPDELIIETDTNDSRVYIDSRIVTRSVIISATQLYHYIYESSLTDKEAIIYILSQRYPLEKQNNVLSEVFAMDISTDRVNEIATIATEKLCAKNAIASSTKYNPNSNYLNIDTSKSALITESNINELYANILGILNTQTKNNKYTDKSPIAENLSFDINIIQGERVEVTINCSLKDIPQKIEVIDNHEKSDQLKQGGGTRFKNITKGHEKVSDLITMAIKTAIKNSEYYKNSGVQDSYPGKTNLTNSEYVARVYTTPFKKDESGFVSFDGEIHMETIT